MKHRDHFQLAKMESGILITSILTGKRIKNKKTEMLTRYGILIIYGSANGSAN